jgi:hypothetical protein
MWVPLGLIVMENQEGVKARVRILMLVIVLVLLRRVIYAMNLLKMCRGLVEVHPPQRRNV